MSDIPIPGTFPKRNAPKMKCAVCDRILFPIQQATGQYRFAHSLLPPEEDHQPVPVPHDSGTPAAMVCDFCSTALGARGWTFTTIPFMDFGSVREESYVDDGEWTACRECKALILNGAWNHLSERAIRLLWPRAKHTGMSRRTLRKQVHGMHKLFKDYWNGKEPTYR